MPHQYSPVMKEGVTHPPPDHSRFCDGPAYLSLPLSLSFPLFLPLPFTSLIFTVTLLVSLLGFESFGNRVASSVPVPAEVGVTLNCTVPSAPGAKVMICPIPVFTPFRNRLTFRVWLLLLKFFTVT